jgi:flagellar hook-length control protein FliK
MNANLVDIAATVTNMVQNAVNVSDASAGQTGNGRAFEDRFQQEINRLGTIGTQETGPVVAVQTQARAQRVASKVSDTTETMEGTSGVEFLEKLEQALLEISGGSLENLTLDAQGLDALKKLLLKAGFDSGEVNDIIVDLKETSETDTLSLDEIFNALSELEIEVDEKADTEAAYLETSALPFVKMMLSGLGMDDDDIAAVMDEADGGGEGISLDVIIDTLETLAGSSGSPGNSLAVEDSDDSFKTMMARLNLPVQNESQETVTIDDLIQAFEDYKVEKQSELAAGETTSDASSLLAAQADSESVESLVNTLFQSISLASETESLSFSYQQIKDQFVNDMIIPSKDGAGQKGLFAQQTPGDDTQMDKAVKEIASLFSGNTKAGTESLEPDRSMNTFGKELKSEVAKTDTVFQASTGNSGSDLQASTNTSEPKSTARTLPAYVTNQVGRGIVRAVNQGETSLKLQLKPPELGRLTMTIDHQSTGVKVSIVTENHAARDILASNVNELKSALSTAGISLESFEVDMNSDFKQSMANTGNQSGQSGRRNGNRQGTGSDSQADEAGDDISISAGDLVTDGSYHFVA